MLAMSLNVPEVVRTCKEMLKKPGEIVQFLKTEMIHGMRQSMEILMESEISLLLGRDRYAHGATPCGNRRNGHRIRRYTVRGLGELEIRVPRDRLGKYRTNVLPPRKRYEDSIGQEASMLFLLGMSTRNISLISKQLFGRSLSAAEISENNRQINQAIESWRTRDLRDEEIKYLFIDGVNFPMRIGDCVTSVSVLAVLGVDQKGLRKVIGLQAGDKESANSWREMFRDLKNRGLAAENIRLGIMDGLPGLEKVFQEEFAKARIQRCQVHVRKNVMAKVPKKLRQQVGDAVRTIFYASSKAKAKQFFIDFKEKYEATIPSAVKCLENNLDHCLNYLNFPEEEWISLRTTNIIERLNKEFKRRTRPMEILAGEKSSYRILAIICLKMEMTWRSSRFGRDHSQLSNLILERAHQT